MPFLEKAFSNTRLVLVALIVAVVAVFTAFMTSPHDSDPDWIQTMFIAVFAVVAVFAFGMAEADFARIARGARTREDTDRVRARELLDNARREVQRLRDNGWTRSDFNRALADSVGEERETAKEAS